MSVGTRTKLFLGHAAADCELAESISERLGQAGLDVEAFGDIRPGEDSEQFVSRFRDPMTDADTLAFLVTPQFVDSRDFRYLAIEVGAAMMLRKPIYALYDGLTEEELPDFLKRFQKVPVSDLSRLIDETTQAA